MKFIERVFQEPTKSYFLFGPRGTGKSTLMHRLHPKTLWINLLEPETYRLYLARPERLYEITNPLSDQPIVIDEIQKVPTLLSVIHDLIEKKKGLQFILTGSSARKLKRTSANLLGGRAFRCTLHPFMASELGENFVLKKALQNGMLPLAVFEENPEEVLNAYISLYLQEEIHAESLVRILESFARFLEIMTFAHGSVINITNISRECAVKRKTVESYLEILEELLLAFRLPIFKQRATRELSTHPKFYFFDSGVFFTLRPRGPLDHPAEIEGAALEGLVAQHLKAWNDYSQKKHTLAFWRTRSGVEVDFVLYGPLGFWGVEVKNSTHVFSSDTKPLQAFLQDYPQAKALLLYRGKETSEQNNVLCMPCETFLKNLLPNQPIF